MRTIDRVIVFFVVALLLTVLVHPLMGFEIGLMTGLSIGWLLSCIPNMGGHTDEIK